MHRIDMERFLKQQLSRLPSPPIVALIVFAGALSWDGLRQAALDSRAVHHNLMAGVWALTIDLLWIVSLRAISNARSGRAAWALTGLATGVFFSSFQFWLPPKWIAQMVPVVALLAAYLLETFVVRRHVKKPAGFHLARLKKPALPVITVITREEKAAPKAEATPPVTPEKPKGHKPPRRTVSLPRPPVGVSGTGVRRMTADQRRDLEKAVHSPNFDVTSWATANGVGPRAAASAAEKLKARSNGNGGES